MQAELGPALPGWSRKPSPAGFGGLLGFGAFLGLFFGESFYSHFHMESQERFRSTNLWSAAKACVVPGGCSRQDAPVTPTERQRKVKPKGKAVFNLHFQLFSVSRWEDGDMFCSLDPHKDTGAAEALNASAERSIIHVCNEQGKGYTAVQLHSWLSPAWTWTSWLWGVPSLRQKGKKFSKLLIRSGGWVLHRKPHSHCGDVRSHCATLGMFHVLTCD